jgi:hypothetical protein
MFPESFVEKWIERLAKRTETVFDPFCGRGTTPFQALLMNRNAIACDINPVAWCVTNAKTNAPGLQVVRGRISSLQKRFDPRQWRDEAERLPEFFRFAYDPKTLLQLLYLRSILNWRNSNVDCMIAALALGSLHGDMSDSYLSNQMPRTISTKPAYSVRFWQERGLTAPERDVFEVLRSRATFRYESEPPEKQAEVYETDMRELPRCFAKKSIGLVITSPPYLDVTSYEEDQWLRLWFLGSKPHPTYGEISRDDRHERPACYWNLISDLWRMLGQVLDRKANIVIRIGGKGMEPEQMVKALSAASVFSRRSVTLATRYEVSEIKKKQTDSFRPGSKGCLFEVDCHFQMA